MAYSRSTTINGKIVYFNYNPATLFDKVQMLSQYHSLANKDKDGIAPLDSTFSSDHRAYFDDYCREALARFSDVFVKVNHRLTLTHYYYSDGRKQSAYIAVTDYGFVKNSLLHQLDNAIENGIIHYILHRWYTHMGIPKLAELFSGTVASTERLLHESLFQFLRKIYIPVWGVTLRWSSFLCTQQDNFVMTITWSNNICVQGIAGTAYDPGIPSTE